MPMAVRNAPGTGCARNPMLVTRSITVATSRSVAFVFITMSMITSVQFHRAEPGENKKTRRQTLAAGSWNSRCGFYFCLHLAPNNTAAKTDAPPAPGGIDRAAVVIGLFHLYEFALL